MTKRHFVTFVLDETGSMNVRKKATISGFNEWMQELEKFVGDIYFTLVKFNSLKHEIAYKKVLTKSSSLRLSNDNYSPAATTPLFDAIGKAIRETEKAIQGADDVTVTFTILTDGQENSSSEWSLEGIKSLIKEKEADGWTFTYLGVAPDAWNNGMQLDMSPGNSLNFSASSDDTVRAFKIHAQSMMSNLTSGGGQTSTFYVHTSDEEATNGEDN